MTAFTKAVFCAAALTAGAARADGAVFLSAGGNLNLTQASPMRGPVSLETVLSFGEILRFDLGLFMKLATLAASDSRDVLALRPGLRLGASSFPFYLRAAVPLLLSDRFDYRLMIGAGLHLPLGDQVSLFVEVDTQPSKVIEIRRDRLEGRAGFAFGF